MKTTSSRAILSALACVLLAGCNPAGPLPMAVASPFGVVVGTVEDSPGIAASSCRVLVEGVSNGTRCSEDGTFVLRRVPVGARNIIAVRETPTARFARRVPVGVGSDTVVSVGTIGLLPSGSIGGRVRYEASPGTDYSSIIVAVRGIPLVVSPNAAGAFLIPNVPVGSREVQAWGTNGTGAVRLDLPAQLVPNVAVRLSGTGMGHIRGRVRFNTTDGSAADAGSGDAGTVRPVQLRARPQLAGMMATATIMAGATGTFDLPVSPGLYWLELTTEGFAAGEAPLVGIIDGQDSDAGEIVFGSSAADGDLDGDGLANGVDTDADDDGVPNAMDAFPFNAWEHTDTDSDGLGNFLDPDDMNTGRPELQPDLTDCDMDGRIESTGEDNCACLANADQADVDSDGRGDLCDICRTVANADQADRDRDMVGDVCDNCPDVRNTDQADRDGDMIGDACEMDSMCRSTTDCPLGQLCDGGRCTECITAAQCPQTLCLMGVCTACSATVACPAGTQCSAGRCVRCVDDSGCASGQICQLGACVPRCVTNMDCAPGQMCRGGHCASCSGPADCPSGTYCDANGNCHAECVTNSDCRSLERCDTSTHRCLATCESMRACAPTERCDAMMVCRPACDSDSDCDASGLHCDSANHVCVAECDAMRPCGTARECRAGACVPDGTCAVDRDCPADAPRCLAGRCAVRGTIDPMGTICTAPCDCIAGEICGAAAGTPSVRHCILDPLGTPAVFVSPTGAAMGTGRTPGTALATIQAGINAAMPGETVAVLGGMFTAGADFTAHPRIVLAGGYVSCGTPRWVRDPGTVPPPLTRIVSPAAETIFRGQGTAVTPIAAVVITGFDLQISAAPVTDTTRLIDIELSDGLRVESNLLRVAVPPRTGGNPENDTGVRVRSSTGAMVRSNEIQQAAPSTGTILGIQFVNSGGTIASNRSTGRFAAGSARMIDSIGNASALTIALNNFVPMFVDFGRTISVTGCAAAVTANNNTVGLNVFQPGPVAEFFTTISSLWVERCEAVNIHDNDIGGGTLWGPQTGGNANRKLDFVHLQDASGLFSLNTVHGYTNAPNVGTGDVIALRISGASLLDMVDNDISVGSNQAPARADDSGRQRLAGVYVVSTLPVRITGGSIQGSNGGDWHTSGVLYDGPGRLELLDIHPIEGGNPSPAANAASSAVSLNFNGIVVIGRCDLLGGRAWSSSVGLYSRGSSVTAFNNIIAGGDSLTNETAGVNAASGGRFTLVANAIHGGGSSSSIRSSGIRMTGNADAILATNNIISSGSGATRATVYLAAGAITPAQWNQNYLYAELLPLLASDVTGSILMGSGNIDGGTTSCYDPSMPATRALLASSRCVNAGPTSLSIAGVPITTDYNMRPRITGLRADIGPFELP